METCPPPDSELLREKHHQSYFSLSHEGQLFGLPSGFQLWNPSKPTILENGLPEYEIIGTDGQICQIPLAPDQAVTCEHGGMCYTSNDVQMKTKFSSFFKTVSRVAGGGGIVSVTYSNDSNNTGYVAMTPSIPGVVVPIDMRKYPVLLCSPHSYLCSMGSENDTVVGARLNPASSWLGCLCGGEPLLMQEVRGGTTCFLAGMGTIITKALDRGEEILVDSHSILGFTEGVSYDVRRTAKCCSKGQCCGGAGLFNTLLTGPGTLWMESMSIGKLRRLFPPPPPPPEKKGTSDVSQHRLDTSGRIV